MESPISFDLVIRTSPDEYRPIVLPMRYRNFWILAMAISAVHVILTISLEITAFIRFDIDADAPAHVPQRIAGSVVSVLMQPGMLIWDRLGSARSHSSAEWIVVLLNSALWGVSSALFFMIFVRCQRLRTKR
jgi:hypothetical protein